MSLVVHLTDGRTVGLSNAVSFTPEDFRDLQEGARLLCLDQHGEPVGSFLASSVRAIDGALRGIKR